MLTRDELKGIIQGLETQSVQVSNCSFEMLRWIEDGPKAVAKLLADVEQLQRDVDFERSTNNFDAKRLRRLATLVGVSTPESDETLLGCAGTVIGSICRLVEGSFKQNQKLRATLKEVSGCHEKHDTPKLCEGCLMSVNEALS